jgi:tRNA A-37 threonylcarbamoyl transferase component Bud32
MMDHIPQKIGRYNVISELGRGGMATVYKAHDPLVKREVAIKLLPREFLHNTSFRTRFEQEAQAIAALEYPAVVPLYDYGEETGQLYLVMRYMAGGSLADRIERVGIQSIAEISRIFNQIAPSLDAVHQSGLVHRDLKPANILFDGVNNSYISDFGLVKLSQSTSGITASGLVGTPAYMAPEMAAPGGITGLADIYALGVTLYEAVTGMRPYDSDTPISVLMAHVNNPVPDARQVRPDVPDSIQHIIERAMAKKPADRYGSAQEMASDLADVTQMGKTQKLHVLKKDATPQLTEEDRPPAPAGQATGFKVAAIGAGAIVAILGIVIVAVLVVVFSGSLLAALAPKPNPTITPFVTQLPTATFAPTTTTEPGTPTSTPAPTATSAPAPLVKTINVETIRELVPARRFEGHLGQVNGVAFSPDGTRVASGSQDGNIIIWDVAQGVSLMTLRGHGNWVHGVEWSPDGSKLASASSDRKVIIWDTATGGILQTLSTPSYGEEAVDWSPDGSLLATGPYFSDLILWSTATGVDIGYYKGHADWVTGVSFSPDGTKIATSSRDNSVRVWDTQTGEVLMQLDDHTDDVWSVAWSPDGSKLASGGEDRYVMVWDAATGQLLFRVRDQDDAINSVSWSPDSKVLASGSNDKSIVLWNLDTGDVIRTLRDKTSRVLSVDFSPDGSMLAAGSSDNVVTIWGFVLP